MVKRNKIIKGVIATLGYLLSPLSWWNDLVLNIPLAYGFAYLFGLISQRLFFPMMILGYWITNVAGLILMHQGIKGLAKTSKKRYGRKEFVKDIAFSVLYTLIIVIFIKMGWLKFPTEYFN